MTAVAALLLAASAQATGAVLPDGRSYEMVSPVDKNGGDVLIESARTRAATSGNALDFGSLTGFGDVHGTAISTDYIAERGPGGWVTHGITPEQEPLSSLFVFAGPGDAAYEGEFSDDLSHGVVRANAFPAGDLNVATVQNLFVRDDLLSAGPGSFSLLSRAAAPIPPIVPGSGSAVEYRPGFAGASANFGHVIFESNLNLTQQATDAGLPEALYDNEKLYEWDHGTVRLVGILPQSEGGGVLPLAVAGRAAVNVAPSYTTGTISDDGSRIFFTVPAIVGAPEGQIYMRQNASETVHLNVSERQNPDPPLDDATFWGATPDGLQVFFTTSAALTNAAPYGGLYRYDVNAPAGEHLTLLSVDQDPADGTSNRIRGVIGTSQDGSWVYFVSTDSRLLPDAPVSDPSTPTIYLWHAGTLRYVAKLYIQAPGEINRNTGLTSWQFYSQTGRVTPDGEHLMFLTAEGAQAPPHDHGDCTATSIDSITPCREVYIYSADANGGQGQLACASCDPAGAPGSADAGVAFRANASAARTTSHLNHPLSADGRWVFFGTAQPLVAGDRNSVTDVYRYEVATGDLSLISSGGADAGNAYFLDASPSGRDVFFAARERLVGWDADASYDIYDARVGGGFPEPPPVLPACDGDACQGHAALLPGARPPASALFRGAGNLNAAKRTAPKTTGRRKCKRGHVRKRVRGKARCVKQRARHGKGTGR